MRFECIDERFSTTRRLTRKPPESDPCFQFHPRPDKKSEGGLRTKGLYKADGAESIVTVVTIVYNRASSIEETMLSVLRQTYSNIEYIVIDGGSNDGTLDVIRKYDHAIDYWISEPDQGIYDAVNKGVRASSGQWLNFMNTKDSFYSEKTIQILADKYLKGQARFIYSDIVLKNSPLEKEAMTRYECDHRKMIVNHQGSVYQKSLHREYGPYIVAKGMTISDYLFFSLIDPKNYLKADEPIAIYDMTGISSSKSSMGQKYIVDYLINGMPKSEFVTRFLLGFYYRELKALWVRFFKFR